MNRLLNFMRGRAATAWIVLLGLAARLLMLLRIAPLPLMSDAASYSRMGADLAAGRRFVPFWPPGLPLYLAAVASTFGASELAARLAMLPFYLALCWALYRMTLHLTGEPACGNLALLPLAFAPGMICASVEPVTEMPSAMLLTLAACILLGVKRGKAGSAPWALGAVIGCMTLLRPASLILLSFAPFYLAWRAKSRLAGTAVCLIPLAMVAAWVGYVHGGTGQWVAINTANAKNFYYGNNPQTPLYRTWWMGSHHQPGEAAGTSETPEELARYSSIAREYVVHRPGLFLLRTFNRVCVFFALNTYAGAYAIEEYGFPKMLGLTMVAIDAALYFLVAIGSILYLATLPTWKGLDSGWNDGAGKSGLVQACLLLALCLLYASPYFVAFSHPRYRFPMEPLLMAASAAFALPFIRGAPRAALERLRGRRIAAATAIALFLAIQIEFVVIVARAGLL